VTDLRSKLRAGTPAPGQEKGEKRSAAMVKKIISSLSSILAEAQDNHLVSQNVVRNHRRKKKTKAEQRRKLKAGVDFPEPNEIKAIIGKLEGRWRPLLLTAIFTGLRASELRGLRWSDVDLKKGEVHVQQRADRYNKIDAPKSEAGERTVPLPTQLLNVLREWKLACPKSKLDLVFPNGSGHVENHGNIINRGFVPAQIAAGVAMVKKDAHGNVVRDEDGKPVTIAKYTGLHALRHFYASWCINRKKDGGLELPGKVVQEQLGHSSIVMTMDVYGHLFKGGDDSAELAKAAETLMA
jgi:integrase